MRTEKGGNINVASPESVPYVVLILTLLHSKQPKLHRVLAVVLKHRVRNLRIFKTVLKTYMLQLSFMSGALVAQ